MDEILYIDSGMIEHKPRKSAKTSSGRRASGADQIKSARSSSGTHDSGDAQVKLAWDSVPGARSYNIYWSTSPKVTKDNGKKIANVTNPYLFKGIKKATTYYFVVTAVNAQGESAVSSEIPYSAVDR
jgi:hypothetical protein